MANVIPTTIRIILRDIDLPLCVNRRLADPPVQVVSQRRKPRIKASGKLSTAQAAHCRIGYKDLQPSTGASYGYAVIMP
jgi:hypothetical protein